MNENKSWVELAIKILKCSQKDLALKLDVSPTQITKWKNGESMSNEIKKKFRKITSLTELDTYPEDVLLVGSIENEKKWKTLINYIAEYSLEENETGMECAYLEDRDEWLLSHHTLQTLKDIGIKFPSSFPGEIDVSNTKIFEHSDNFFDNDYVNIIHKIFLSLQNVVGFFNAYIANDLLDLGNTVNEDSLDDFEYCLLELATTKIDIRKPIAPGFNEFKFKWINQYEVWIDRLKNQLFNNGIPIKVELSNLVKNSDKEIGHKAEEYSLGFNRAFKIHPDVYMNELLSGMRAIHYVLPKILEKLDIKIDQSELQAAIND